MNICNLSQRVHTGIGTTRACNMDRLGLVRCHTGQDVLDLSLNCIIRTGLTLPAIVTGSIILN